MTCTAGKRCGTNAGYSRWGGRCDACVEAHRRYSKRQQYRRATVGPAYVDATPAAEHLRYLNHVGGGAGIGAWWFLEPAKQRHGLSATQLRRIAAGDIKRVWPKTRDAILSLSLDDYDTAGQLCDKVTFQVLTRALLEKGWTKAGLSRALVDLGAARADAIHGSNNLQQSSPKVRRKRLDALRALLTHPRPPQRYVSAPFGGWDAWWNQPPAHDGTRHHTRRGCYRRGCRNAECSDANRLYGTALRLGADQVGDLTVEVVELQRRREFHRDRKREQRERAA